MEEATTSSKLLERSLLGEGTHQNRRVRKVFLNSAGFYTCSGQSAERCRAATSTDQIDCQAAIRSPDGTIGRSDRPVWCTDRTIGHSDRSLAGNSGGIPKPN